MHKIKIFFKKKNIPNIGWSLGALMEELEEGLRALMDRNSIGSPIVNYPVYLGTLRN